MNKKQKQQKQQGDIWFEEAKIPEGAEPVENKEGVFAYGEGHHVHVASNPAAVQFFKFNDKTYVRVTKPVIARHVNINGSEGEHTGIELLSTDYEYGHVQEVDHFAKLVRKVVD